METAYLSAVIENLKDQIEDLENEIVVLKDEKKDLVAERQERYNDMEDQLRSEINDWQSRYEEIAYNTP